MVQSSSKKRRLSSKAKTASTSDSGTPRGVVRKLQKGQRPRRPTRRDSKKKVDASRDKDAETTAGDDAGAAVIDQNKNTRTPGGTVSSATKLKLAAFSAADIGVCDISLSD